VAPSFEGRVPFSERIGGLRSGVPQRQLGRGGAGRRARSFERLSGAPCINQRAHEHDAITDILRLSVDRAAEMRDTRVEPPTSTLDQSPQMQQCRRRLGPFRPLGKLAGPIEIAALECGNCVLKS
jgi:hypothetical protein